MRSCIYPIFDGEHYGFIDRIGRIIISPRFDNVIFPGLIDSDNVTPLLPNVEWSMIPVQYDGLYGYLDSSGNTRISPRFDQAFFFDSFGMATICKGEKWGCVDTLGRIVIPIEFDQPLEFVSDVSICTKNSRYGLIDRHGRLVLPLVYDSLWNLDQRGWVCADINDQFGLLDISGNVRIPPISDSPFRFSEGFACVFVDGLYGYIDEAGSMKLPPEFSIGEEFHDGLALVSKPGNKGYWYISKSGDQVFQWRFSNAKNFYQKVARVEILGERKWGMIRVDGSYILSTSFKRLDPYFFEDVVYGWREAPEVCGFWTIKDSCSIHLDEGWPYHFYHGLCAVRFDDFKFGYIDHHGQFIFDPRRT